MPTMPTMPSGKIAKYNPQTDIVAGRTASQIEAAKRKAVGGKKKKCVKGKSCSATCIAINKVCLVDIPWAAAQSIPKVVNMIITASGVKVITTSGTKFYPAPSPSVVEPSKPPIKPAPAGQSEKGPEPKPGERWKPVPGFVTAEGPKPNLPPFEDTEDFQALNRYVSNKQPARDAFDRIGALVQDATSSNPSKESKAILDAVGGKDNFLSGVKGIRRFTGTEYGEIRTAQKKLSRGESLSSYEKDLLQSAINAERLLAHLPKEPLVKYRGVVSTNDRLQQTILASQDRAKYQDGALASWSVNLPTAKAFTEQPGDSRIIYRTVNKRGTAIQELSQHHSEGEVLTPASAQYRHTGKYEVIKHGGETFHVFDVEEL